MVKPEKQFANFGVALLKEAVVEFVRSSSDLSTTEVDNELQLDKAIGTKASWLRMDFSSFLKKKVGSVLTKKVANDSGKL